MEGSSHIGPDTAFVFQKLGNRLLVARLKCGLSQDQLAAMVGLCSGSTIAKFEAGKRAPNLPTLIKLAFALQTETSSLLRGFDGIEPVLAEASPLDGAIVLELVRRKAITLDSPHIRQVIHSNLDKLDDGTLRRLLEDLTSTAPPPDSDTHAA